MIFQARKHFPHITNHHLLILTTQPFLIIALKDNIAKKGKNAYYYAHGHGANGPVWDGKEEPRLLSSEKSDGSTKEKSVKEFASYAWADQTNSVKIYIDYEGADQIEESDINVWNTVTSLEFTVQRPGTYSI